MVLGDAQVCIVLLYWETCKSSIELHDICRAEACENVTKSIVSKDHFEVTSQAGDGFISYLLYLSIS